MSVQILSKSHRRRIMGGTWSPGQGTTGGYTPAHWYRSDGPLWMDSTGTLPALLNGNPVGRWDDKTANADHVSQIGAIPKPTLYTAAAYVLNGHPILRFDGAFDYLQGTFTTGGAIAQPTTMLVVAKLAAAAVNDGKSHPLCHGSAAGHRQSIYADETAAPDKWAVYAGTVVDGTATDSTWHIFTATFNGASSALWLGGVLNASGNAGAEDLTGLTLGSNISATTFWYGDITEYLVYGANLPNADKNQLGQYLATRYALSYTDIT